jgi:integral membrane protein
MISNLHDPIRRIRYTGFLEAISFLLLLGVAMPLKYWFGQPLAVRYVGMAHGGLVILLCGLLIHAWGDKKLSFKNAALAFVAMLLPFGPFVMDRRLKGLEAP